ncbi:MAG: glutaminyl-peptide cyclotransferase [Acidobacteriota bacterium]|nr:glutaminyl-peptide cyclotransferase [Acidobacteriota bacterium]
MAGKKKKAKKSSNGWKKRLTMGVIAALVIAVFAVTMSNDGQPPVIYGHEILNKYPHDPKAFTQGLLYRDGFFYESTGLNGHSSVRKVKFDTGQIVKRHDLADEYFGEGLAFLNGKLYQLTYQKGKAFVYNAMNFNVESEFSYKGEGWGLTHDDTHLIMSNGTSVLTFRDPETFKIVRELKVREDGEPVEKLNELEYINGEIWANIWRSKRILRISPKSGHVTGRIDMRGLPPYNDRHGNEDYLNGIAYDQAAGRVFVTGKKYAYVYHIKVEEKKRR